MMETENQLKSAMMETEKDFEQKYRSILNNIDLDGAYRPDIMAYRHARETLSAQVVPYMRDYEFNKETLEKEDAILDTIDAWIETAKNQWDRREEKETS